MVDLTSKQSEQRQGVNVLFYNSNIGHQITLEQRQGKETLQYSECEIQISLTFLTIIFLSSSAGVHLCSSMAVVKAKYKQNNHNSRQSLDNLEFSAIVLMIQIFMSQDIGNSLSYFFARRSDRFLMTVLLGSTKT